MCLKQWTKEKSHGQELNDQLKIINSQFAREGRIHLIYMLL